jgi:hypothetical protein
MYIYCILWFADLSANCNWSKSNNVDFTHPSPTLESTTNSIPTTPGPATEDSIIPAPTTSPTLTGQTLTTPKSQLQEQEQQPPQEPQPEQEPTTTPDDIDASEQNPIEVGNTNDQDETRTEGPDSTGVLKLTFNINTDLLSFYIILYNLFTKVCFIFDMFI